MRSLHVDTGKIWRGGQRQCNLLCRRLAKWGHETHLVCQPGSPLWQRAVETGLVLHPLRAAGETDPLAILKLARLLRRIGPELAAAHDAHGLGLLALARPLSGIAVPLVCHRRVDVRVARWPGSGWKMRRASMLICVSRRIADILEQCGLTRERIRVVHSGAPGIQPAREARTKLLPALGLEPDCTVLATVGGLIPHKGHRVLLEALRQLELARTSHQSPATSAQLHLVMIGDGPLRGQLRRQAAQAGLTARVHFLGDRED
ncbi:MAG: glycosyltransferase, partial [Candidatus Eisenbacteria sp.]|nr:glycosyltransferase [Candidatus Eisenbacteria bacterium]